MLDSRQGSCYSKNIERVTEMKSKVQIGNVVVSISGKGKRPVKVTVDDTTVSVGVAAKRRVPVLPVEPKTEEPKAPAGPKPLFAE